MLHPALPATTCQQCLDTFGVTPRPQQLDVVNMIGERKDCILIAGTGWGKTLVYFLPLVLWPNDIFVIITPLKVLGDEQMEKLEAAGIRAIHLKRGINIPFNELASGHYTAVFMSPEIVKVTLQLWSQSGWKRRVRAIIVDEAHCVGTWGNEFRTAYKDLGILRTLVARSTCFVAVSATLPRDLLQSVTTSLKFHGPATFNFGNDRANIKYHVRHFQCPANSFQDLCFLKDRVKTIVYFQKIGDTEKAGKYVRSLLGNEQCAVYHSEKSDAFKKAKMESFKNGRILVLLSTEAAGMGCDISDVQRVVQFGFPDNISTLVQRLGRAARSSQLQGDGILLIPNPSKMRGKKSLDKDVMNFAIIKNCRRRLLNDFFGNTHQSVERCCDNCQPEPLLPKAVIDHNGSSVRGIRAEISYTSTERERVKDAILKWRNDMYMDYIKGQHLLYTSQCVMSDRKVDMLLKQSAKVRDPDTIKKVILWQPVKPIFATKLGQLLTAVNQEIVQSRKDAKEIPHRPTAEEEEESRPTHHALPTQNAPQDSQRNILLQSLGHLLGLQLVHHLLRRPPLTHLFPWHSVQVYQPQGCNCCIGMDGDDHLNQSRDMMDYLRELLETLLRSEDAQKLIAQPPLRDKLINQPPLYLDQPGDQQQQSTQDSRQIGEVLSQHSSSDLQPIEVQQQQLSAEEEQHMQVPSQVFVGPIETTPESPRRSSMASAPSTPRKQSSARTPTTPRKQATTSAPSTPRKKSGFKVFTPQSFEST